jgi:hypothetical protein
MSEGIKILWPQTCEKCGKQYGKTNGAIGEVEIWQSCDCQPPNIAYFLDTKNIKYPEPKYLSEPQYLQNVESE